MDVLKQSSLHFRQPESEGQCNALQPVSRGVVTAVIGRCSPNLQRFLWIDTEPLEINRKDEIKPFVVYAYLSS